MSPIARQPSVVATLLRYLAAASKHRAMYPHEHPIVRRAMEDLVQVVDLLLRDREIVSFQIYEDTFFLDNQMLPEESLRYGALLKSMQDREIGLFALQRGVTSPEIAAFVGVLAAPPIELRAAGGATQFLTAAGASHITVEGLRTAPPTDMPIEVEPSNAYEAGNMVVQQLRTQAIRRQPLDLNKARVFLSAAIEVVLENRYALLGLIAGKDYDEGSSYHAVNVSILALLIGTRLGLEQEALMTLGMGALLHDVGKVRIPQRLLSKATALSGEEHALLDKHPVHGGNILRDLDGLSRLATVCALEHHVNFDGSGYPALETKARPHLFSRIVAVADAYDTVTSARRSVHRPLRPDLGMKWIAAGLNTVFDPVIGKLFLQMMGIYPVGSLVHLNTGNLAVVMRPNDRVDRPVVQIVRDGTLGEVIDLAVEMSRWITSGVDPEDVNIHIDELLGDQPTLA